MDISKTYNPPWLPEREKIEAIMGFFFGIPQPPAKPVETPLPARCSHKCPDCGMYYQHTDQTKCAEARHLRCSKKG